MYPSQVEKKVTFSCMIHIRSTPSNRSHSRAPERPGFNSPPRNKVSMKIRHRKWLFPRYSSIRFPFNKGKFKVTSLHTYLIPIYNNLFTHNFTKIDNNNHCPQSGFNISECKKTEAPGPNLSHPSTLLAHQSRGGTGEFAKVGRFGVLCFC